MRLRRRIRALEERITTLETLTGIDYTMPPRYDITIPTREPIATLPGYDEPPLFDDDEGRGIYL